MIASFRHKGLRLFFWKGIAKRVPADLSVRIRRILLLLDGAKELEMMNVPGLRLHSLRDNLAGFWSVRVSSNWRIIFRFEDGNAHDVDLIDYH